MKLTYPLDFSSAKLTWLLSGCSMVYSLLFLVQKTLMVVLATFITLV